MDEKKLPWQEESPGKTRRRKRLILISALLILTIIAGGLIYFFWRRQLKSAGNSRVTKEIYGTSSTYLNKPLAVALYAGKFYVTDAGNHRVVAFAKEGRPLFYFKGGSSPHDAAGSSLVYPSGIAINSKGEIYVADSGSGKVIVFNESGRALRFLRLPTKKKQLLKPLALAVDEDDNIYISEAVTGNLYLFDRNEALIKVISQGNLAFANGIAIRGNGDIYVADSNNQRIVVYDQSGKLVQIISHKKANKSFLPRGLAFDRKDDLLIADTLNSHILELDRNGREILRFGEQGNGSEQFNFPTGLAYSKDGKVYIVDSGNNRIVVWEHMP